jgi:hypothetical protein
MRVIPSTSTAKAFRFKRVSQIMPVYANGNARKLPIGRTFGPRRANCMTNVRRPNSQEKIRAVYEPPRDVEGAEVSPNPPFDFSRPDHISKSQIRAIHT